MAVGETKAGNLGLVLLAGGGDTILNLLRAVRAF